MKYFGLLIFIMAIGYGHPQPKILRSSPGYLSLEFKVDTIVVSNNKLNVKPHAILDKTPGHYSVPIFQIPLVNVSTNAKINLVRSEPIELIGFNPKINENEKFNDGSIAPKDYLKNFPNSKSMSISSSGEINGNQVSSLHLDIIKNINGKWFWYKKTNIELKWNNQKKAEILSDHLMSPIRSPNIQIMSPNVQIPDYMYSNNLIRIDINSDGFFRIPLDSLFSLDPSLQYVDHESIQLFNSGTEQLLDYDPDLGLIFYGKKAPPLTGVEYEYNLYTNTNHYWLTWGDSQGLRYSSENVYPLQDINQIDAPLSFNSIIKFEENDHFQSLPDQNTTDQWDSFDHYFFSPTIVGGGSQNFGLYITDASLDGTYNIKVRLQAIIDGSRRINISLNNRFLGSAEWNGNTSFEFLSDQFLNDDLINGLNQLHISVENLDGMVDRVALDWAELRYDRKYKAGNEKLYFKKDNNYSLTTQFTISGFSSSDILLYKMGETRLTDFIVTQSENSLSVVFQDQTYSESQKYFITSLSDIPYPQSIKKVDPLLDIHLEQSNYIIIAPDSFRQVLTPMINHYNAVFKTPESIYRTYSNGVLDPHAIKEFLLDAHITWSTIPEYVLIAQDLNIPAMYVQTVGMGATYSDYWYTLLEGSDYVPEVSIGRYPARTIFELETMVNKNMHVINSSDNIWENSVLMIAGYNEQFRFQTEDLIANIIDKGFFPERLFVDMYSENSPFYGTTDTLINYFGRGLSYINFFGHGGGAVWGDRSLFTLDDIGRLNNNKTPFITSMTCFTGDAKNPNSLGRNMLAHPQGGSYGWLGSSGLGWVINDYLLLDRIHSKLFSLDNSELPIGPLINQAKLEYLFTNITFPEIAISILFQFNLLGDPAINISNGNTLNIQPDSHLIDSGSEIQLNINSVVVDSLFLNWYDGDHIPITDRLNIDDIIIDVPDNIDTGQVTLVGVYKDNNQVNNRFSIQYMVNGTYLDIQNIEPEYPIYGDSISFDVFLEDQLDIASVECWVDESFYTDLSIYNESIYRLDEKIAVPISGNMISFQIKVKNSNDIESWSNPVDIYSFSEIDVRPTSLSFPDISRIGLLSKIKNHSNSYGDYDLSLDVKWESDSIYQQIIYDSLFISPFEEVTEIIDLPLRSGSHDYRFTIHNKRKFVEDMIYTIDTTILTDRFWITNNYGTTEDLIKSDTVQYEAVNLFITPNQTEQNEIIFFNNNITIQIDQQPSLNPIIDQDNFNELGIQVNGLYPWSASWNIQRNYGSDTSLYTFDEEIGLWVIISGEWEENKYQFSGNGSGSYVWMQSTDRLGPVLEATIDGNYLLKDNYISSEPEIIILARDENEIKLHDEQTKFFKNGQEWSIFNDIEITRHELLTRITFNPILSINDTMISFVTSDNMGNESDTLILDFIIAPDMKIIDYGNFPNPFNKATRFSYELTRTTDDLNLKIYTVDGRHVREYSSGNYYLNSPLNTSGYHEILWDGRDQWGVEVANGIYFYKYNIKYDGKSYNSIGKVARSR
tara:strand:- start:18354 stop:22892 length:4539 start_codon:yes stop_codon:yes gene_type:complete